MLIASSIIPHFLKYIHFTHLCISSILYFKEEAEAEKERKREKEKARIDQEVKIKREVININVEIYISLLIYILQFWSDRLKQIARLTCVTIVWWGSLGLGSWRILFPSNSKTKQRGEEHISYPILSYPILSYPILSYPILSYPILSYPILSYPILSYSISTIYISIIISISLSSI